MFTKIFNVENLIKLSLKCGYKIAFTIKSQAGKKNNVLKNIRRICQNVSGMSFCGKIMDDLFFFFCLSSFSTMGMYYFHNQ